VFAVALNGGENRSNVNARGTFATLMKSLFSNMMVDVSRREIHGEIICLRIYEIIFYFKYLLIIIMIVIKNISLCS
jgi:hypothetical protein